MNTNKWTLRTHSIPRWLIAAGLAVGLMVPLSASADHEGNGAVEVLVSAAIAYAVIDAVGRLDNDDRNARRHRDDRYRDRHHDRDYRYWERDRRYSAQHDHRRHDRRHNNKHRRQHAKHHGGHRYGSGDSHYRRGDRQHRYYANR